MFSELTFLAVGDTDDFAVPQPPTVDAGGPYAGDLGEAIQLNATVVENSATDVVLTWESNHAGTFSNVHIEDPTFTPDDVKSDYTLTLTVTSSNAAPVDDSAGLTSSYVNNAVSQPVGSYLASYGSNNTSANSSLVIVSGWYQMGTFTPPNANFELYQGSYPLTEGIRVLLHSGTTSPGLRFQWDNGEGSRYLTVTSADVRTTNKWIHFIFSMDMSDSNKMHVAINGTKVGAGDLYYYSGTTKTEMAFTGYTDVTLSDAYASVLVHRSDTYAAYGQWLDLSVSTNIDKFISATGEPVYLGAQGELPTGTPAKALMYGTAGGWNAGVNKGTGNDFSVVGAAYTDSSEEPVIVT